MGFPKLKSKTFSGPYIRLSRFPSSNIFLIQDASSSAFWIFIDTAMSSLLVSIQNQANKKAMEILPMADMK
jgi:hypothetical protein